MNIPRADDSSQASASVMRAALRLQASIAFGIDVEHRVVPGEAFRLDFERSLVEMPVTACRHGGTDGNGVLGQAGRGGARRRGEHQVPQLVIDLKSGGGVRTGKADGRREGSGDVELLVLVLAPAVMGADRRS